MLKRMNKRGQGLSTETLIITLLAVGVGILVIVGFTVGWDKMIGFFKKTDIDITLISENCEIAAGQGAAGFCSNKMMISSKNYVNCPYAIEKLGVKINSQQQLIKTIQESKREPTALQRTRQAPPNTVSHNIENTLHPTHHPIIYDT